MFTKVLKPVFARLREKGYISTAYIDDSCLQGQTYAECEENILETVRLMDNLGLTINPNKSVLIPSKQIVFVGFVLCSETMTIRPTKEKVDNITNLCIKICRSKFITIRTFAKLIGMLVVCEPGVRYAPLYYKPLERVKDKNLNWKRGNYGAFMKVTEDTKLHIHWWIQNLRNSFKFVYETNPDLVLTCDSSLKGWGGANFLRKKIYKRAMV